MGERSVGDLHGLRHELRTCVDQILGYSGLLREEASESHPAFLPDLDRIDGAGRRVLGLLDGLFEASAQPAEGSEVPARLLVIDDQEMNRDVLSRRLARRGYDVSAAVDGHDALRRIASDGFDLVLLDVMMPGMSGFEVLEGIRRSRDRMQLPVIMATARDGAEDVMRAFEAGANDYVTKPFEFPVVLARVETQLQLKRAHDQNRRLLSQLEVRNRFIRSTFGRYLSDEVVSSLLDQRDGLRLGGERRRITILMSDLRGFTPMSERLDPARVVSALNLYLEAMTEAILAEEGTIDEFIGDAILVFFGAPVAREDHAAAALRCATRMQRAMEAVNADLSRLGLPPLAMGIGIHTGEVIVGNIGSDRRAKYSAVGSHINLAARIQAHAQGGQVLASQDTLADAPEATAVGERLEIHPQGFDKPVTVYTVSGGAWLEPRPPASR